MSISYNRLIYKKKAEQKAKDIQAFAEKESEKLM